MQKTIVVNGQKAKLSQSDVLGVGGEATVVKVGSLAVKIFHPPKTPDDVQNLKRRAEKLEDFLKITGLPKEICAPQALAYDSRGKQVIGYAMQMLSPQCEVVQMLSSKKFRQSHPELTSAVITDLFLDAYQTTARLHPLGIVVGDFNDLNALFWKTQTVFFIDADSFQFGNHPCMVGTENFLDPQLYNLQLATKPYFKPEHDWYSWLVMYIRSLLMVHPYGGVHKQHKTVPQRALARVTFFDPDVKYPKAGFHPDLLDDGLKALFDRMFKKGERFVPPREVLEEYRDSLVTCNSCSVMYPSEHSACPQCAKVNTQQIQRQVKVVRKPGKRTVNCEKVLETTGNFIWRHLSANSVYAIAIEGGKFVLHCSEPNKIPRSMPIPLKHGGHPRFEFCQGHLAVNDGLQDLVYLYSIDNPTASPRWWPTDSFHGSRVFSCSRNCLFRVSRGFLFRTDLTKNFFEDNINAVAKNQTWISGSSHSDILFGMQRFFDVLKFFVYRFDKQAQGQLWYPPIESELKDNESIIDASIRFSGSSILLLLKTEIQGKTFVHCFIVHQDTIGCHYRVDAVSSDTHRNIHGKAFAVPQGLRGVVLHPTDDGVVQEVIDSIGKSQFSLIGETEQFVSESDTVDQYKNGLLVTGDKTINYLTIV
jgi:hypothetical protein